MLRTELLHARGVNVIDAAARGNWTDLRAQLRPFVARRVPAPCDVDDVLQDIFLRMQKGLAGLRDEERFGPWVLRVARSAIADHRRRAQRHAPPSDDASKEADGPWQEPDENAVQQELATYVARFVAALPSPYREALTLTELEGLTQKDAAAMLGVSVSTMKSRVQRGRVRLRELFEACCEIALDARGRVTACEPRPDRPIPCRCFGKS
jgi:RNA polymerase sigma-70 factor, ECF subfamily